MKVVKLKLLCSFGFLLFTTCEEPTGALNDSEFSISFLKDTSITFEQASKYNLNEIKIQDTPWLIANDISMYDYSTHYIYVRGDKEYFFKDMVDEKHMFKDFLIKPFVLLAGHERVYLGSFISSVSSIMCAGPNIRDVEQLFYPSDIIPINGCYDEGWIDVRNDDRIEQALKVNDLFHAGLDIKLNSVEIIDNSDTSTVQYTFTVTNNDKDNLYIPDPGLMGSELFHYYTNGVILNGDEKNYWSEYKRTISPDPHGNWDSSWFEKIIGEGSITRTVLLKGYPNIPAGTYHCDFQYSGPRKIEYSSRYLTDGRYWIGRIKSNKISITVGP